jgi:peroxiredoxin Q/BCP
MSTTSIARRSATPRRLVDVIAAGSPAPDFTLPDQDAHPVPLSELRGSWVVLWWFPKASTGG